MSLCFKQAFSNGLWREERCAKV
uniref:Uncharacterized protein n=1 Tax=Rhizophora mucronata TaxID=61149 RepID=A0A2P2R3Z6_RHIMU